jgi:predicted CXXCH cytochrome family protein
VRVLIRTWTRQGSERSSVDRIVDADVLTIGRGTDQHLELPDMRLALAQAEIVTRDANAFLVAKPGANVVANGESVRERKLKGGDVFEIGRFRLQVNAAESGKNADFQIDVEEQFSQRDERAQRLARLRTSLTDLHMSRRTLSMLLFLLVLLPTLLIPAWLSFGLHESGQTSTSLASLVNDHVWKPGELSNVHASLHDDCRQCHEKPFERVRNEACLACHQNSHQHVDDPHLLAMPEFANSRCEDCHKEHRGARARLVDRRDVLCASCHAQSRQLFPGSGLSPAANFSKRHPAFTVSVARYDASTGQFGWIQASQEKPETLHSDNNLKFPHDLHLARAGIHSPNGDKVLGCPDCHVRDANGVSFKPVQMQRDCAGCHRLEFDPSDPSRVLPHAQPAQIVAQIRDFYAHEALAGGAGIVGAPAIVQQRHEPGLQLTATQARASLDWADHRAARVIDEVFTTRTCNLCHTVRATGDAALPYTVLPVAPQRQHLLAGATEFNHSKHASEPCSSCHATASSKSVSEVTLPDIKRCRDCHGDPASAAPVQSTCVDCHDYHPAGHNGVIAPAAPRRKKPAAAGTSP